MSTELCQEIQSGYEEGLKLFEVKMNLLSEQNTAQFQASDLKGVLRQERIFVRNALRFLNQVKVQSKQISQLADQIVPSLTQLQVLVESQLGALSKKDYNELRELWMQEQQIQIKISKCIKPASRAYAKMLNVFGVLALMLLLSNCASLRMSSEPKKIETVQTVTLDSHGYSQYLHDNEYVLPDEIINWWLHKGGRKNWWEVTAFYKPKPSKSLSVFYKEFIEISVPDSLALEYASMLSQGNIIIYRQSGLQGKRAGSFIQQVFHERIHMYHFTLPQDEKQVLDDAATQMQNYLRENKKQACPGFVVLGIRLSGDNYCLDAMQLTIEDRDEFYPQMAEGDFSDEIISVFQNKFSRAYAIYLGIIQRAREKLPL